MRNVRQLFKYSFWKISNIFMLFVWPRRRKLLSILWKSSRAQCSCWSTVLIRPLWQLEMSTAEQVVKLELFYKFCKCMLATLYASYIWWQGPQNNLMSLLVLVKAVHPPGWTFLWGIDLTWGILYVSPITLEHEILQCAMVTLHVSLHFPSTGTVTRPAGLKMARIFYTLTHQQLLICQQLFLIQPIFELLGYNREKWKCIQISSS
jgi:hypothetical protein